MKKIYAFLMTLMMFLVLSVPGHATLIDMGDGTIYETDLQLSWLKDANYAKTSGYNADGLMTWSAADTWAKNLVFAEFDNWRLPTTLQPDPSCSDQYNPGGGFPLQGSWYNCIGSEMGHLYYTELGNVAGGPFTNTGDFTNLQPYYYWSGTVYAPDTTYAWAFLLDHGYQGAGPQVFDFYALAVRPGQRSTSVPEPTTLLLMGFGLAGIAVYKRGLRRRVS